MSKNSDWVLRRANALPRGIATAMPICVERASNAELWDVDGRRFIDFAAGIAVLNVGHQHPRVVEAVQAQMQRFAHTAFQVAAYDVYIELCERLNSLAPIAGKRKSILFSTGAEAVENAIKIARAATRRHAVIAFHGGFHGRSFMAMALTGKTAPYKRGFGPLSAGVFHAPFPCAHRGISVADSLQAIERIFMADVAAEDVAAIIVEPVQGEGGFNPAPDELLQGLRELADRHGILLVADEVQSGIARTGRLFGMEHSGVQPDLMIVAKSLAAGFPLSAVIGRAEVMDAVDPGGLGGTYAGSPTACAAALAVLDLVQEQGLAAHAEALGQQVRAFLQGLQGRPDLHPIGHIRGRGSMLAFDLLQSTGADAVAPEKTREVIRRAHELGLVVLGCGAYGESIRLLYPLTIDEQVLDEGLGLLEQALKNPG
ncbi:4-aminobutyrate aminotransferase [Dyella thiooxydans]|uniref:4-aminobutyrate aminotransferase n=1 Tax=Dyella thiooxydans TaxID=445710 RepID=A0A160MX69_9GAMM|nr:4-aminobutyrate--2-oxoglutarate transaminase [Dyella thiooxydans]AND67726.1 4-aminobutyrate aminotransferase [Dyella thiooxydans]